MAISYIGNYAFAANNPTSDSWSIDGSSGSGAYSEDSTSGWQAGDLMIVWWYSRSSTKTLTEPAAFTDLYEVSDAAYGYLYIGYRWLQAGDNVFSFTASSVSNATTVWGLDIFRGVDTTNPIEADSGSPTGWSNAEDPNPPAVNVATAGAAVIAIAGKNNDITGGAPPSGYTVGSNNYEWAGSDAFGCLIYKLNASAGSNDPGAIDLSGGASTDDGYVWTAALKPAGASSVSIPVIMNHLRQQGIA